MNTTSVTHHRHHVTLRTVLALRKNKKREIKRRSCGGSGGSWAAYEANGSKQTRMNHLGRLKLSYAVKSFSGLLLALASKEALTLYPSYSSAVHPTILHFKYLPNVGKMYLL